MEPMQEKLADGLHPDASFSRYTYLLVIIDTFTGWIQGFPTWSEKAEEVVKKLLHEIIARFGLPRSLQSDDGTPFTSKVTQWVFKALFITSIMPGGLSL